MRDLKFRAWDDLNKRMIYDYFWISSDGNLWRDQDPHGLDMSGRKKIGPTDKLHVMQCTGLKDVHGKEIYEGDIIELVNANNETIKVICEYGITRRYVMGGELMEVDIPGFYFKLPNGKKTFPIVNNYLGKHDLEIFEIIGNIYENPDLIPKST